MEQPTSDGASCGAEKNKNVASELDSVPPAPRLIRTSTKEASLTLGAIMSTAIAEEETSDIYFGGLKSCATSAGTQYQQDLYQLLERVNQLLLEIPKMDQDDGGNNKRFGRRRNSGLSRDGMRSPMSTPCSPRSFSSNGSFSPTSFIGRKTRKHMRTSSSGTYHTVLSPSGNHSRYPSTESAISASSLSSFSSSQHSRTVSTFSLGGYASSQDGGEDRVARDSGLSQGSLPTSGPSHRPLSASLGGCDPVASRPPPLDCDESSALTRSPCHSSIHCARKSMDLALFSAHCCQDSSCNQCCTVAPRSFSNVSLLESNRHNSIASFGITAAADVPLPDNKQRWLRSWFFSKNQKKTLAECNLGQLVYLFSWYPQYPLALLNCEHRDVMPIQKSLCNVLFSKLLCSSKPNVAHEHTMDIIFWHVLCHEFQVNNKTPLRQSSAVYLLSFYLKDVQCTAPLQQLFQPILEPLKTDLSDEAPVNIQLAHSSAEKILHALLENAEYAFPKRLYELCSQIRLLSNGMNIVSIVGGRFFILLYVAKFITGESKQPNKLLVQIARLLQLLCSSSDQRLANEDDKAFYKRNRSKMEILVAIITTKFSHAKECDMMNQYIMNRETLLDMERLIQKPQFSTDETRTPCPDRPFVFISTSDVYVLAKAALLLTSSAHGTCRIEDRADGGALRCYCAGHYRYLEAIVQDQHFMTGNEYLQVCPTWVRAPFAVDLRDLPRSQTFATLQREQQPLFEHDIRDRLCSFRDVIYRIEPPFTQCTFHHPTGGARQCSCNHQEATSVSVPPQNETA